MNDLPMIPTASLMTLRAPYNPRRADAQTITALRQSMRAHGCVLPVVLNKTTGCVVGGHQRILAALEEGIEQLPVIWIEVDDVSERKLNLALNRIHGTWDEEALTGLLQEIHAAGEALDLTGFGHDELSRLLGDAYDNPDPPTPINEDETEQVLRYVVAFDDMQQMSEFFDFLRWLGDARSEPTASQRIIAFLKESLDAVLAREQEEADGALAE